MIAALLLLPQNASAFQQIAYCGSTPTHWNGTTSWRLTTSGGTMYSSLSNAQVEAAVGAGFDVWRDTATCCSDFTHQYGGTTTSSGQTNGDGVNAIEFEESQWPASYGSVNSVIAVTVPQWGGNCAIGEADQLYNAVGFNFTVSNNPGFNDTDLQSIAAHENGHWLGLDHSSVGAATMYFAYSGGTGARSLHSDDEAGVCDSHPGVCGPAETNCTNSVDDDSDGLIDCSDPDCSGNAACASGVCPVDGVIGCDNTITGSTVGGADTVSDWACVGWQNTGPEATYTLVPSEDGPITVDLTGLSADLDLFVAFENSGSCEPPSCLGVGQEGTANEQLTFNGFAGVTYAVIVDGFGGASSSFTLSTDCPDPQGGGDCYPSDVLPCNGSVSASNYGFENNVQDYSCAGWQTTGPEIIYSLTPTASGQVTVDLTGLTADLDLFITTNANGQCDNNSCVAASGNGDNDSEQATFTATAGQTYMVIADGWEGASSNFTLSASCPGGGGDADADADADSDSDMDVDTDSDADADADTDGYTTLNPACGCNGSGSIAFLALPLVMFGVRRRRL